MSEPIGQQLGFWTVAPFGCLLVAIAVLPLVAEKWLSTHRNQAILAGVFAVPMIVYLIARFGQAGLRVSATAGENYIAFIVLLVALFTISGGIYITGNLVATPRHNLAFLLAGAALANIIGTLGASMLLIRPLLRANSERKYAVHTVVFFIFMVCNIAGMLLPLGPPLYLGFLQGIPFTWFAHLWPQWLLGLGLTTIAYLGFEIHYYRREPIEAKLLDEADYVPMRVSGKINILLFGCVIAIMMLSGVLDGAGEAIRFPFLREILLAAIILASLRVAPKGPRAANNFRWAPMVEVAVLFAGIFATMIPALALLEARGSALGLSQPWHYFWTAGGLSAFLDNAPAFLTFMAAAQGQLGVTSAGALVGTHAAGGFAFSPAQFLAAISSGSVMMGAITYVGNAPNLAVRAIAEHSGLKMPSFFGYMKYSLTILIPILLVVTVVFFI
ncbi:MAG: sodium:proton antiporter [Actinobacteria bacterium]|nr:sodium:proton antiporter [Actinomycetota bacterium]